MKYIITNKDEVRTGQDTEYHKDLAKTCKGEVIAAGYYRITEKNTIETYGESIGFLIKSKPEDANKIAFHQLTKKLNK